MKTAMTLRKSFRILTVTADTIVVSIVLTAAVLPVLFRTYKTRSIVFTYALILIAVSGIRCLTFRKKEERKKKKTAEQAMLERILLLSDCELERITGEEGFYLIRKPVPDQYDVLEAIRSGAKTIGMLKVSKEAYDLVERYAPETKIIERRKLFQVLYPDTVSETRHDMMKLLDRYGAGGKYFMFGFLFLFASFLMEFKIYYRLISGVCLTIAFVTGLFRNQIGRKKL